MAAKVKLNKQKVARIAKLRDQGKSVEEVAETIGVAKHVVRKVLIAGGSKRASAQSVERAKALVAYWTGQGAYPTRPRKPKAKHRK